MREDQMLRAVVENISILLAPHVFVVKNVNVVRVLDRKKE